MAGVPTSRRPYSNYNKSFYSPYNNSYYDHNNLADISATELLESTKKFYVKSEAIKNDTNLSPSPRNYYGDLKIDTSSNRNNSTTFVRKNVPLPSMKRSVSMKPFVVSQHSAFKPVSIPFVSTYKPRNRSTAYALNNTSYDNVRNNEMISSINKPTPPPRPSLAVKKTSFVPVPPRRTTSLKFLDDDSQEGGKQSCDDGSGNMEKENSGGNRENESNQVNSQSPKHSAKQQLLSPTSNRYLEVSPTIDNTPSPDLTDIPDESRIDFEDRGEEESSCNFTSISEQVYIYRSEDDLPIQDPLESANLKPISNVEKSARIIKWIHFCFPFTHLPPEEDVPFRERNERLIN